MLAKQTIGIVSILAIELLLISLAPIGITVKFIIIITAIPLIRLVRTYIK